MQPPLLQCYNQNPAKSQYLRNANSIPAPTVNAYLMLHSTVFRPLLLFTQLTIWHKLKKE